MPHVAKWTAASNRPAMPAALAASATEIVCHSQLQPLFAIPDLKQLVLGLSVSADGSVPLVHKIYDGNQTDDRLHPENHQRLRQLLKRSDFIYVADCKLATEENLRRISGCGGRFVSVMPRTWKEDALFRQCVRGGQVQWDHLLSRK